MDLVGKVRLTNIAGGVADVTAFGNYAYLAAWAPECGARGGTGAGVHVVDISNPSAPARVTFMEAHVNSLVGEGMHVIHAETPFFRGELLVHNNEPCRSAQTFLGGFSIWDVTNPLMPILLTQGAGDPRPRNPGAVRGRATAREAQRGSHYHSVQAWSVGNRAFLAGADNEEATDVDIWEITDPHNPRQIADVGIDDWPAAQRQFPAGIGNFPSVSLHDMQVNQIGGHWFLLLSYWDAGWILLNVDDPARPVYVDDSDYPVPDPLTRFHRPEGNAHQAFWSSNNRYIVGTDEDFDPFAPAFQITAGANAGSFDAGEFPWTRPLEEKFPNGVSGPTVWGGTGCPTDVNGNGISDRAEVPAASSVSAGAGETKTIVFTRGTCFFSEKVESGQLAGYDFVIIGNSHAGAQGGVGADLPLCGALGHQFTVTAAAICIGHRAMHLLFNDTPEYRGAEGADMPPIGTRGANITARHGFDAWGYVHLLDARSLDHIGAYAVREALDPAFARGFGDLTVHEVKTDPRPGINLGYLAYYAAGARVVEFDRTGIREVGHFIDQGGNDFWGTFPHYLGTDPNVVPKARSDRPLLLFSDRDYGLYILRYTGAEPTPEP